MATLYHVNPYNWFRYSGIIIQWHHNPSAFWQQEGDQGKETLNSEQEKKNITVLQLLKMGFQIYYSVYLWDGSGVIGRNKWEGGGGPG